MKINALIEEMNFKIAENKLAFREELARLKFRIVEPLPEIGFKKVTAKRDLSIPVFSKDKKMPNLYDS